MSSENTQFTVLEKNTSSIGKKLAYGVGALANGLSASIIGFFILGYMLNQLNISNEGYALIQGVTQLTNAISDPLIGLLSDKARTRFGRRRPFLLLSALSMPVYYFLLFTDFGIENKTLNLLFYLTIFILFYTAQTLFNVPHMALLVDMDDDESVRNSFAAYSSAFFALGNLIGPISLLIIFKKLENANSNKVFSYHALAMGAIMFVSILIVFAVIREKEDVPIENKSLKDVLKDYVSIMKYPSYRNLTLIYISSQIAVQTLQFNLQIYLSEVLMDEDAFVYIMPISLVASILCIYPLVIMVRKLGKKKTYFIGMTLFLPVFFTVIVGFPEKYNLFILSFLGILAGIGTGTAFYISSVMLPDVIVEDYLNTGKNREGAFSSFYVFLQKISTSLSHSLTSKIYAMAGGIIKGQEQTMVVKNAIRYTISVIPIVFIFMSFIWIYLYPLTKERVAKNQEAYMELKGK